MSELRMDLQLNYVLSSEFTKSSNIELAEKKKIALILYIYYEEAIEECLDFARNMPNSSDVFFISTKQEVLDKIKENCKNRGLVFSKTIFTKKVNKGRDLSSYLIDLKHVFDEYDYVCYFHDKKSPQLNSRLQTREFFYHCMNSLLPSSNFVYNIIEKFENEPNLGLLVPPPLHFGPFYPSEYNLHPSNKEWMLKLLKELKLNVPFDEFPVAPYGDMFWVRGKAMSSLFNKDWTYDDLPDEPIDTDGTILHALERMIPFVAQDKGYFTSWLCSEDSARTEISNFYYGEKTLKQELFNKFVFCRLDDMSRFIRTIHNEKNVEQDVKPKYSKRNLKKKIIKYTILNIITLFVVAKFRRKLMYLRKIN
jgi:rhamnosyltransferase